MNPRSRDTGDAFEIFSLFPPKLRTCRRDGGVEVSRGNGRGLPGPEVPWGPQTPPRPGHPGQGLLRRRRTGGHEVRSPGLVKVGEHCRDGGC